MRRLADHPQIASMGVIADIAVFDPETVTNKAAGAQGTPLPSGISYLIVNGVVVTVGGKALRDVNPGPPIRQEWRESQFELLDVGAWTQAF